MSVSASAKQVEVPLVIIQRTIKGNLESIKFYNAYSILKTVDPPNFKDLLLDHYKHFLDCHGHFDFLDPSDAARHDAALTIAMSSSVYCKIHCLASTYCRTTSSEVYGIFWMKGIVGLDELLNQGVLIESEDCIKDPFNGLNEPKEENIRRKLVSCGS